MHHLRVLDRSSADDAVADPEVRLTVDQFRAAVAGASARLASAGVGRHDVVAAVVTNRVELLIALYAAWDLGAAFTPVNPALTPDEIAYQLDDAGARVAIVEAGTDAKVKTATIDAAELLEEGDPRSLRREAGPDLLALLVYTSGTTGRPKGVMLDHRNIDAMTQMLLGQHALTADDRALLVLPLFHVNAIMVSAVLPLAAGASTFIGDRFNAHEFWLVAERERSTYFSAVPAMYFFLNALPDEIRPAVSSIRFAVCGAAPMPTDTITSFETRYGIPIIEGYGLSESTVALTSNPVDDRRPGTVGRALPGVELAVIDDDGHPVPAGVDGEIIARGPNVMRGYFNKPEETAAALVDGWLHTGDVGHLDDDGFLVLVDRKKDLIIRGGENISPTEVEAVLVSHPTVAQAAVVGEPDPVMGEKPVAFIVATPGSAIDADILHAHCRTVLASFKVPRTFHEIDELPRNAVGKVTKDVLRRRLSELRAEHP